MACVLKEKVSVKNAKWYRKNMCLRTWSLIIFLSPLWWSGELHRQHDLHWQRPVSSGLLLHQRHSLPPPLPHRHLLHPDASDWSWRLWAMPKGALLQRPGLHQGHTGSSLRCWVSISFLFFFILCCWLISLAGRLGVLTRIRLCQLLELCYFFRCRTHCWVKWVVWWDWLAALRVCVLFLILNFRACSLKWFKQLLILLIILITGDLFVVWIF